MLEKKFFSSLFVIALLVSSALHNSHAATYFLSVQPILNKERTQQFYQPLADYLSQATGHTIKIYASYNFVSYWEELRKNQGYDIALDAAHFTDYRAKKLGYTVIAKILDTVSYSLVSNEQDVYFDAQELIGKRIATLNSPSIGGVRLLNLYPNPLRQPKVVGVDNFQQALDKLKAGETKAALVPTPLINGDSTVNTILTTEPVPHMAVSVSTRVDETTRKKIQNALLSAAKTTSGQKLLEKVSISGFEAASNKTYDGYDNLLQDVWGF